MEYGENCSSDLQGTVNNDSARANILLYYICVIFIILPGFVTNAFALFFIMKDIRKAVFPAIVLLLTLISSDIVADVFTGINMGVSLFVDNKGFNICASLLVPHTFFLLYSASLNAMMSVDRALAICVPYFYKRRVHVNTWKTGCLVTAVFAAAFSLFPVIGLGDVTSKRCVNGKISIICSVFGYQEEIHKKIYSAMYGAIGWVIILTVVFGNSLVICSIFKMKKRVVPVMIEQSSTTTEYGNNNVVNTTSFEVAFAKLMGCLAVVYLLSKSPMNVLILVELATPISNLSLKGTIHILSGLSYSVDPMVYILMRKTTRRKIARCLRCDCLRQNRTSLPSD